MIYGDSWTMANDLAGWPGTWKKYDWKIDDKEISLLALAIHKKHFLLLSLTLDSTSSGVLISRGTQQ